MVQTARVTRLLEGNMAEITVKRQSACGGNCASCKADCTPGMIVHAIAKNEAFAKEGDEVTVESGSARILGIAALIYLVPLILFFAAFFLADLWGLSGNAATAAGGFGFLFGFIPAILINRKDSGKTEFVITSVEEQSSDVRY